MRTRFTWVLGILVLIAIGLLLACGRKYSSVANGLVVVATQGNNVMETFSLNLNTGGISQVNNANGPPTLGKPTAVVLDPAGAFAYVLVTQNSQIPDSATGIAVFPVLSDGKLGAEGNPIPFKQTSAMVTVPCGTTNQQVPVAAPVVPVTMVMDSAGKYLFVADSVTNTTATYSCNGTNTNQPVQVPGTVSVFAVSNGSLTEVPGSPFSVPLGTEGPANLSALAVSPTVFPTVVAACAETAPPTSENLYVTDAENNTVWEFGVSGSGALGNPPGDGTVQGFATGLVPSGVTVDPCNRYVYVSDFQDSKISAYTICNTPIVGTCPIADGSLLEVAGSPFADQDLGPGPLSEDTYGAHLYVVNTSSNSVAQYRISLATGALTQMTPAVVGTQQDPVSIAVRNDNIWVFVANFNSASVSQYAIQPSSGQLTVQPEIQSNSGLPFGVAVK
jgi:hypothetical protein